MGSSSGDLVIAKIIPDGEKLSRNVQDKMPALYFQSDRERGSYATSEHAVKATSLSTHILEILKAEPNRKFLISDIVDLTGAKSSSVRKTLSRLARLSGKLSGPVMRVDHGIYQYDPGKERHSLQGLVLAGDWKLENLVFVSMGGQSGSMPLSETSESPSNSGRGTPLSGYPFTFPTGQQFTWEQYENGTQIIRISARGAPPLSVDLILYIIDDLQRKGQDLDNWYCTSIEVNKDSRKLRVDDSYSLQIFAGVLLKIYQHGYSTRIEIADRRKVPIREIVDLLQSFTAGLDQRVTLKEIAELKDRVHRIEKNIQPRKMRSSTPHSSENEIEKLRYPIPEFVTAATLKATENGGNRA
jgi:hypothetical protein